MPNSVHAARWISQLKGCGWELHLYPGYFANLNPEIRDIRYHAFAQMMNKAISEGLGAFLKLSSIKTAKLKKAIDNPLVKILAKINDPEERSKHLVKTIQKVRPHIIHSMEFQSNGYLTLHAKKAMEGKFPAWLATNWGSDIFLYGRFPEHREKIRELLSRCDYYSCETQRDVSLARGFGFKGSVLPVIPNSGGFDLARLASWRSSGRTSERRIIMIKGYQNWAGRALVAIRALQRCLDVLGGYEVVVYLASGEDVKIACNLLSIDGNVKVTVLPPGQTHETILRYHGQARISIGLSISDAVSTSFLEAIAMGSFPIQSNTAAADEWIEDGVTGMIVPPEDPEIIEKAIRKTLSDDEMVDRAAEANWRTVTERLDYDTVKATAIGMYKKIYEECCL